MEGDIFWGVFDELNRPGTNYRRYREMWLRVCKNISQAGRPVLLCSLGEPTQFEQCVERRYFSEIFYLALVCEDEVLAARLRSRSWTREPSAPERMKKELAFNQWLKDNAKITQPPMALLDTTELSVDETATAVARWVNRCMSGGAAA
jgi:hypothetical protein